MDPSGRNTVLCNRCDASFSTPVPRLQEVYARARTDDTSTYDIGESHNASSDAQRYLTLYDAEISRLDNIIAKLRQEREEYQTFMNAISSLSAPIRRMPAELLSQIFHYCTQSQAWSNNTARPVGLAPLNLGLVCRSWRDIAISAKDLWSDITLDLTGSIQCGPDVTEDILTMFLERSEPLPLCIHLDVGYEVVWDLPISYAGPLRVLAESSERWRMAQLYVSDNMCSPGGSLAGIEGKLPILEELDIRYNDGSMLYDNTIFLDCPKLHNVALADGVLPAIPWEQISSYRSTGPDFSAMMALRWLDVCPPLRDLIVDGYSMRAAKYIPASYAVSSNLQILVINTTIYEAVGISTFLDLLTLPSLKSFSMKCTVPLSDSEYESEPVSWPHGAVVRLLCRSTSTLGSLTLDYTTITAENLLEILHLTPALSNLHIRERPFPENLPTLTNTFLETVTYSPTAGSDERPPLLPGLTHIDLTVTSQSEPSLFLNLIESRWEPEDVYTAGSGGVACLEHVALRFVERELDPASVARFQTLRSAGLRVLLQ